MPITYEIVPTDDGAAIRCRLCGRTSHNPNDVREAYCGACHLFHQGDPMTYETLQSYYCDGCDLMASVSYPGASSIFEVIDLICADHKERSPECAERWGMVRIRVVQSAPLPD